MNGAYLNKPLQGSPIKQEKTRTPSVSSRAWDPVPECQGLPVPFPLELQMACQRAIFASRVITLMPDLLCHFPYVGSGFSTSDKAQREKKACWPFRRGRGRWQKTMVAVGHGIFEEEFSDSERLQNEFEMALNLG